MMCDRTGIKNSDWHLLCQLLAMRSRTEPSVAINFLSQTTVLRVLKRSVLQSQASAKNSYYCHLTHLDSGNTWFFLSVSRSWFLSPVSPGFSAGSCSSAAC